MRIKKAAPFTAMAAAFIIGAAQAVAATDASPLDLARQLNEAFIQVADQASAAALVDFCLALFNANEFVYVP